MDFEEFFGLKENPFRLAPEPKFFFPGILHRMAVETLATALTAGEPAMLLTGGQGLGKTLVARALAFHLRDEVDSVFLPNPHLAPEEIWAVVHKGLLPARPLPESRTPEDFFVSLKSGLDEKRAQNKGSLVIVDQAQDLSPAAMDTLAYLSALNMEGETRLPLLLVGRLSLEDRLRDSVLGDLADRISIRFRLAPLSRPETPLYVQHRLKTAGGREPYPFHSAVLAQIHKATGGLPRLINSLCERAMMAAFVDGRKVVEKPQFDRALTSLAGEPRPEPTPAPEAGPGWFKHAAVGVVVVLALLVAFLLGRFWPHPGTKAPTTAQTPSATLSSKPPTADASSPPPGPTVVVTYPAGSVPGPAAGPAPTPPPAGPAPEASGPKAPSPPQEAVFIPGRAHFVTVDRKTETAHLWEGQDGPPVLKAEFKWPSPPPDGLYMVGRTLTKKRVFFVYAVKPLNPAPPQPSKELWADLEETLPGVVPVLVVSPDRKVDPGRIELTRELRDMVREWAEAWRNKNIDGHMDFFGKTYAVYSETGVRKNVYPKAQLKEVKTQVMKRDSPFALIMDDPLCLLDPRDPDTAAAVFFQRYEAANYQDVGTQILFFRMEKGPDNQSAWKITAKMWLPEQGK